MKHRQWCCYGLVCIYANSFLAWFCSHLKTKPFSVVLQFVIWNSGAWVWCRLLNFSECLVNEDKCWGAWDVSGRHGTGICIIMQMKEIEPQSLSHIYLVGGSGALAYIWILRMQWKVELRKKGHMCLNHIFSVNTDLLLETFTFYVAQACCFKDL